MAVFFGAGSLKVAVGQRRERENDNRKNGNNEKDSEHRTKGMHTRSVGACGGLFG